MKKQPKKAIVITRKEYSMIDVRELLAAGVHFGHKTSRWSPKMRPYIWGSKNKIHLIDVSKTAILLERIGAFIKEITSNGGVFLFVGTKKPAQPIIHRVATSLKMPFVVNRWVGGTLTNYDQVKKAITRLLHLRDVAQKATSYYKKKEIVMLQKEILRLEKNIGGIIDLEYPPAGIIIVDANREQTAVREASYVGIPVIALVDTNTDPEGVSHVIPTNDDSPKAINFVLNYLEACILDGKKLFEEKKTQERAQVAAEHAAKRQAQAQVQAQAKEKELNKIVNAPAKETPKASMSHTNAHTKEAPKAATPHTNAPTKEAHKTELKPKVEHPVNHKSTPPQKTHQPLPVKTDKESTKDK